MEMKKTAFLAAFFTFAVLAASLFAAAGGDGEGANRGMGKEKGYYLQARYQQIACRVDFTTTVMNDLVAVLPQGTSALTADIAKLNGDKTQLQSLVSGEPKAFDEYARGTLKPDMASGLSDLKAARQSLRGMNVSNGTRTQLKNEYDSARATLKTCEDGAASTLINARITQYDSVIGNWNTKISEFGAKGYDTSAMQTVANGATSSVVTPLQNALRSGNIEEMRTALRTYCLGDGCNGEQNASITPFEYHGYAKMGLETLQSMIKKIEGNPQMANITAAGITIDSGKLQDAKAQLDTVRSTLATVGTGKYTPEQQSAIWNGLKQAREDINAYMKGVRDEIQKFREQRQAQRGNRTMGNRGLGNGPGRNGSRAPQGSGQEGSIPPAAPGEGA